jgi:hypothetical protein
MDREQTDNHLQGRKRVQSAGGLLQLCGVLMLLVAGVFGFISRSHPPGVEPFDTFRSAIFWLILFGAPLIIASFICTCIARRSPR